MADFFDGWGDSDTDIDSDSAYSFDNGGFHYDDDTSVNKGLCIASIVMVALTFLFVTLSAFIGTFAGRYIALVSSLLAVVMGIITAILVSNKTQKAVFIIFGFASAILANIVWEIIYRLDTSLMMSGGYIVFALLFTFVIAIMLLVLVIRKTFKGIAGIIMLVSILVNFIFLILFLVLLITSKGLLSVPMIRMSIIMIVFSHLMFLTGIIVNNVQLMTADSEQDEEDYNEQTSDGGDYSDDFGVSTASADSTSVPSEQGNVDDFFGSLLEATPASSATAPSKEVKPVDSKTENVDKPVSTKIDDKVEYDDFFSEEKSVVKQSSGVSPTDTSATKTTPTNTAVDKTTPAKPVSAKIDDKVDNDDFFGSLLEETPASSTTAPSKEVKPVDSETKSADKPVSPNTVDKVENDDFFSEEKPVVKQSSEVNPTATSATETTPTSPVENRTMPDKPVNPGIKAKPMARVMTNAKPASTKVDTGNNEPKKTV